MRSEDCNTILNNHKSIEIDAVRGGGGREIRRTSIRNPPNMNIKTMSAFLPGKDPSSSISQYLRKGNDISSEI